MKQDLMYEVIRKLKTKPDLMRKLKISLAIGIVGLFVSGAVAIWAGVSAFNYVASKTKEVIYSPTAVTQLENLKSEAKQLPKFQALSCWGKAQSLLAFEPWLTRPALDNLKNLKVACLEESPVCEGDQCTQMKKLMNTAEGRNI